jgi:hypothetical protein
LLACTLLGAVACADVAPPSAPDAVPVQPTTPLAPAPGAIGTFVRTGYAVTGSVTLVIRNDTAQLDFSADFNIASTPGPFVYLNTTSNVNQGAPLRIGALRARSGAQRYTFLVPPGVRYTKVIIWCDPFNVGMAEATLP